MNVSLIRIGATSEFLLAPITDCQSGQTAEIAARLRLH